MIPQSVYVGETDYGVPLTDYQLGLAKLKAVIAEKGRESPEAKEAYERLLRVCCKFNPNEELTAREVYLQEKSSTL